MQTSIGGGTKTDKGKSSLEPVDLLFIGNLEHNDEYAAFSARKKKHEPHSDQILFKRAVKVQMLRVVRPKREIYKKYHSVTQSQKPIRQFQVFYRNLAETNSRYSLLSWSDEMLANPNDDILITAKEGVYTDILVIRGFFTKITLCVYGYLLRDEIVKEKCPSFGCDVKVERPLGLIPMEHDRSDAKRSKLLESMLESVDQGNFNISMDYVDAWFESYSDDDQTQIRLISNISETLQQCLQALSQSRLPSTLTTFRTNLESLHSELNKLFKAKHLGLYYPSPFRPSQIPKLLPYNLPIILIKCFNLYESDQLSALQNLRLLLQLPDMANTFIEKSGLSFLFQLYIAPSFSFSTLRILLLEVLLVLAQYARAANIMAQQHITDPDIYELLSRQEDIAGLPVADKALANPSRTESRSRSRIRNKKSKDRSSEKSRDKSRKKKDRDNSKDKKDKKKRKYSDDSEDSRDRKKDKGKSKKQKKTKDKEKRKSRSRTPEKKSKKEKDGKELQKQTSITSAMNSNSKKKPEKLLTFYQIVMLGLRKDQPYKQLLMTRLLIQQLTQTITRDNRLSEQVAIFSPLLREARFLFNPSKQLANPKALKVFGSYYPVLNDLQSIGVDNCKYVSDNVKITDPKKYNLDVKLFKVINALSGKLTFAQFDEQFILFASQLILSDSVVPFGLNKIVEFLKGPPLRKYEAIVIMLEDYLYKVLLEDDGLTSVLYLDQIFNFLLPISRALKEERVSFSRELSRSTKFLINYAAVFDYFHNKENILKALSEFFLKIFKYVHIQASKFLQYSQISSHKSPDYAILKETFNLGNFFELLPEQPLLEIEVSLKVFCVLCKFNKNIWTSFYDYKLTSGFAVLFGRINYLLIFMLRKTIDMEWASTQLQHRNKLIGNYASVINKLLTLFSDKTRYESAFNELPVEDTFEEVEIFSNCLDLFLHIFNGYFDNEIRVSGNTKKKLLTTMKLIMQLYLNLCDGVDLSKNKDRQRKFKCILDKIYISHFQDIVYRAQSMCLYGLFLSTCRSTSFDIISNYLRGKFDYVQDIFDAELSLVPNNDKSILENLFKYNVYKNDKTIRNSLVYLFNAVVNRKQYDLALMVMRIFQTNLKELAQQVKGVLIYDMSSLIVLHRMAYVVELLQQVCTPTMKNIIVTHQFDDILLRLLRLIEEDQLQQQQPEEIRRTLVEIRNKLLNIFSLLIDCTYTIEPEGSQLGFDAPQVEIQQGLFKIIGRIFEQTLTTLKSGNRERIPEQLHGCQLALAVCQTSTKSLLTQTVLLYGSYVENTYRPIPLLTIDPLLNLIEFRNEYSEIVDILRKSLFIVMSLTQAPKVGVYNCQRRKAAIKALIGNQGQFIDEKFINSIFMQHAYFKYLQAYFSQPSVQIKLPKEPQTTKIIEEVLKSQWEKINKKPSSTTDKIFQNLSAGVFDILSEGEQPAKARFRLVSNDWLGGDFRNPYEPLENNSCEMEVEKMIQSVEAPVDIFRTEYTIERLRPPIEQNELILFYSKKQYPERTKKTSPWNIALKQVPIELKAPIEEPIREPIKTPIVTPSYTATKPAYFQAPATPTTSSIMYNPIPEASPPSIAPSVKYTPTTHTVVPSSIPPMTMPESRPMMHQIDMAHSRQPYDMPYNYQSTYSPHMQTYHPSYGTYVPPTTSMDDYRMHQQYLLRQQQEMMRRQQEIQRAEHAYQQAKKLVVILCNKDYDEETKRKAEYELVQLFNMYPDLQRKLKQTR